MAGRPTTCTDEVIQLAEEYIDTYESYGHAIPSVVGLCQVIKRGRASVYEWAKAKDHPFSDILDRINEKQQEVLISKGLKNEFNSNITKLALGKHGYHDKVDQVNVDMSHEEWLDSLDE